MNQDELLKQWVAAETAAIRAEIEVSKVGQAGSDPAAQALFLKAAELRSEAERLFRLLPKER